MFFFSFFVLSIEFKCHVRLLRFQVYFAINITDWLRFFADTHTNSINNYAYGLSLLNETFVFVQYFHIGNELGKFYP